MATDKSQAAALIRQNQMLRATHDLREKVYLDWGIAKSVAQHITKEVNVCHGCGGGLAVEEVSNCNKCKRLNFNW